MINQDIRDQAYQFFIEEAPELLQIIENGLLTLRQDRNTSKVHEIMRAAHSLKGGSASVELDTIKTIAHRIEDIFKAFYNETVEIDGTMETLLLQAYDCLKEPLMQQINQGSFDAEAALEIAIPIFTQIEERLGDHLKEGEQYIPSSSDLGIDIVSSIFEVDVVQGLDRLSLVIDNPQDHELAGELRAQAEVFVGFGELLGLPGWGMIAQAALTALELNPNQALQISKLALADFHLGKEQVLAGDRTQGGSPSEALLAFSREKANGRVQEAQGSGSTSSPTGQEAEGWQLEEDTDYSQFSFDEQSLVTSSLDDVFGMVLEEAEDWQLEEDAIASPLSLDQQTLVTSSVEDIFGIVLDEPNGKEHQEEENWQDEQTLVTSSLDDVFGIVLDETNGKEQSFLSPIPPTPLQKGDERKEEENEQSEQQIAENLAAAVQSVEQIFAQLPPLEDIPAASVYSEIAEVDNITEQIRPDFLPTAKTQQTPTPETTPSPKIEAKAAANLSVRVDFNRLERMNNLVGELAINRNSLSLQNDQLQGSVKEMLNRFFRFRDMTGQLRELSDKMLIAPMQSDVRRINSELDLKGKLGNSNPSQNSEFKLQNLADFDALEMDSYGALYSLLQELLEDMIQLEESVDDIVLFARSSNQTIDQQRQMLTNLRDELMWARMLPLGEVLNRFPRVLRDLSTTYRKPVRLKLIGTGVLVDKAALEKLYDPLLHLLRNAFDHGIELPDIRRKQGKFEEGKIEIRAYHQGNQTIIQISDDGKGLDADKIGQTAVKSGLLTPEQVAVMPKERLFELIFEPGFSTAAKVSELSGRGVGLDVVRSQLQSLKGTVSVNSIPGQGTTFTLRLPLTLTIAKLLVCLINPDESSNTTALALPSDSIEEIIIPQPNQIKCSTSQRFLHWQQQIIPIYRLSELLSYSYSLPETFSSKAFNAVPTPEDWASPLLLLRRGEHCFALEVNRLVTEQELVIKPFGGAIASPGYTYGCTILGDGTLIPVVNGALLVEQVLEPTSAGSMEPLSVTSAKHTSENNISSNSNQSPTILVVDDSAALRRTLALTLQKTGYRILQARDGREALEQLQQSAGVQLVICDVEMPNMNGFEFLGQRRRDPELTKIPVAMLTSRSSEKHRQLATHLGASAYFTKPYIEQQFLTAIANIIEQNTPAMRK